MEERALVFGGRIYIEGFAGKGTSVKIEIPFSQEVNAKR
jgi:signal transduction histidine kinase